MFTLGCVFLAMLAWSHQFPNHQVIVQNEGRTKRDIESGPSESQPEEGEDGSEEVSEEEDMGVLLDTPLGTVRGVIFDNSINQQTYFAFQGIPFAEPPIGELRFMAPRPIKPWKGILDATKDVEPCIQANDITQSATGDEDCLKLSVITPKDPYELLEKTPLPVLVFIHGGAFHIGSYSMESAPDYLMTQQIIFVALRYRLSVFGFLSFEDELVPGNAGLKDQVLGLQWVRDNIAAFGGDPNRVTIFGNSAGASSVHFHMLSPMSTGLFHQAIATSGTGLGFWAISRTPRESANLLADVYNCSRAGDAAVLKCLQAADAYDLGIGQYNAFHYERIEHDISIMAFGPCVEPKNVQGTFISEDPYEMLEAGKMADVPVIMGIMESEMTTIEAILSIEFVPRHLRLRAYKELIELVHSIPKYKPFMATRRMKEAIKSFYIGDKPVSLDNIEPLVKLTSDVAFLIPLQDSVTLQLKGAKSPVYEYLFTFNGDFSFARHMMPFAPPKGAGHTDFEYSYIFYNSANPVDPDNKGHQMAMKSVTMWANFVTKGDPTPDDSLGVRWLPSQLDHRYYLNMGDNLTLEENMFKETVDFWNEIRKKENFTVGDRK